MSESEPPPSAFDVLLGKIKYRGTPRVTINLMTRQTAAEQPPVRFYPLRLDDESSEGRNVFEVIMHKKKKLKLAVAEQESAQFDGLRMWDSLTDNIETIIVNKLPMVEAFVLRGVCKRFRDLWRDLGKLRFDNYLMYAIDTEGVNFGDILAFLTAGLRSPSIDSFHMYVSRVDHAPHVDLFLAFLSGRNIKVVKITTPAEAPLHSFPNIFRCTSLQHLTLKRCSLNPPPTLLGFGRLASLKLDDFLIPFDLLQSSLLISRMIQKLYLRLRNGGGTILIDMPLLKKLYLEGIDHPQIWHPRLTSSCLQLYSAHFHTGLDLLLAPSLHHRLKRFFDLLPNVKQLTLTSGALQILSGDEYVSEESIIEDVLQNLKEIAFDSFQVQFPGVISCACCIIRSSPILHKLSLKLSHAHWDGDYDDEHYARQLEWTLSNSLSTLIISEIRGHHQDFLIVEMLLKGCRSLEEVYLIHSVGSMEEDEEREYIARVMDCDRDISTKIKFRLIWENENAELFNCAGAFMDENFYWMSESDYDE